MSRIQDTLRTDLSNMFYAHQRAQGAVEDYDDTGYYRSAVTDVLAWLSDNVNAIGLMPDGQIESISFEFDYLVEREIVEQKITPIYKPQPLKPEDFT